MACELCTKTGTVHDPIECADASKVATMGHSDACGITVATNSSMRILGNEHVTRHVVDLENKVDAS